MNKSSPPVTLLNPNPMTGGGDIIAGGLTAGNVVQQNNGGTQ